MYNPDERFSRLMFPKSSPEASWNKTLSPITLEILKVPELIPSIFNIPDVGFGPIVKILATSPWSGASIPKTLLLS